MAPSAGTLCGMTEGREATPRAAETHTSPVPTAARFLGALVLAVVLAACSAPPPGGEPPPPPPPPPPSGEVQFALVAAGLDTPVALTNAGDARLFVAERAGAVRIIQNGTLLTTPFLDLTPFVKSDAGEQGLLGLAFPPDYATSGYFYVYYTNAGGHGVLARVSVSTSDPDLADPTSLEELLELPQTSEFHNGGQLAFGPDSYLYWAVGDGTSRNSAQSLSNLRGKVLRLDVAEAPGYSIPETNPYANDASAQGAIWVYGLRNPWRFSFDSETGDLYIADVGEDSFEEVNVVPEGESGQNFGWPLMEGPDCLDGGACDRTGLTLPAHSYAHANGGASITGGYVYRGPAAPDLEGRYVFADYMQDSFSVATLGGTWQVEDLTPEPAFGTASFGEGFDGRLYVTDYGGGRVYEVTQEAD